MTVSVEEALRPPTESEVERALSVFGASVREAYGDRLRGLYLFGSRARGDHEPDSDADVAVVLSADGWDFWKEKMRLTDVATDVIVDSGVHIQAWPVTQPEWEYPERHVNPKLVHAMKRDGQHIVSPAE